MNVEARGFGPALVEARSKAQVSQLDLALRAGTTQRHLSFLERGRSAPGRDLVLRLAEALGLAVRERNALLASAGYLPAYPHTPLDDPSLATLYGAMRQVLVAHNPFPALITDRIGTLLARNDALQVMLDGVAGELLVGPVNVRRVALHPRGLAPRVINFVEWSRHVADMVHRQLDRCPSPEEAELMVELDGYLTAETGESPAGGTGLAIPLHITSPAGDLRLLTTVTSFPDATDVTLSELRLETFLPADAKTAARLESLHDAGQSKSVERSGNLVTRC